MRDECLSRARGDATGLTLIELMIVVSMIAILAGIAIPNALAARTRANEVAAIATMRTIWTAQTQLQRSGKIDLDDDGVGEAGFLVELSGARGPRTTGDGSSTGSVMNASMLSGGFGQLGAGGAASRSGYLFQVYLPNATGRGVSEGPSAPFSDVVDTDLAEQYFVMYAWPANTGSSGERTFFVNQSGEITQTADKTYTGGEMYAAGAPGIAFAPAGSRYSVTGKVAIGTVARDGNLWRPVQ